jgi:hypothetical protein
MRQTILFLHLFLGGLILGGCLEVSQAEAMPTVVVTMPVLTTPIPTTDPLARYYADTQERAMEISYALVYEGGKPGNICGPLSLQLLKDMDFISKDVNIKDFWFLRPWEKWVQDNVIAPIFPPDEWKYYYFEPSLDKIDFSEFPLKVGDFMFFYHGYSCGGTFSHMLTVTRVEENRAYSVTNYLVDDGWRIGEVLLYDLDDPRVYTFFDRLTDRVNMNTIGTTGYCGFSLWRKKP